MAILPDAKDWTWVLERPCPACGFDAQRVDARTDIAKMVRQQADAWRVVLARADVALTDAATTIAASFDAVPSDDWLRRGRRSDGASFTVDSFARYFIHDPIHHLHDVGGADR